MKAFVGIGYTYRTTPLLESLKLKKISNIIHCKNISLLRNIFNSESAARKLNMYFMNSNLSIPGTLIYRVKHICAIYNVMYPNCVFNDNDYRKIFHVFPRNGENGLIDSPCDNFCTQGVIGNLLNFFCALFNL